MFRSYLLVVFFALSVNLIQADHPSVSFEESPPHNTWHVGDNVKFVCNANNREGKDVTLALWRVIRQHNEDVYTSGGTNNLTFSDKIYLNVVEHFYYCRGQYQDNNVTYFVKSDKKPIFSFLDNSENGGWDWDSGAYEFSMSKHALELVGLKLSQRYGSTMATYKVGDTVKFTCNPGRYAYINGPFSLTWFQKKGEVAELLNKVSFEKPSSIVDDQVEITKTFVPADNGTSLYCELEKTYDNKIMNLVKTELSTSTEINIKLH